MPPVDAQDFTFSVGGAHRWAALIYVLFVGYPRIITRDARREPFGFLLRLLLAPLLVPRNVFSGLASVFPLAGKLNYHLRLEEGHFSFGCPGAEMANHYFAVERILRLNGREVALLHDGWLVFIPPGAEEIIANRIRKDPTRL